MKPRAKILLIEDDHDLAGLLVANFQHLGYEVHAETTGRGGIAQLERQTWDAVVLDLILPDIDGKMVCARAQGLPNYTPVIVATARTEACHRLDCYALGADDYLIKPYSIDELLTRMQALDRRIHRIRAEGQQHLTQLRLGVLQLDLASRTTFCGHRPIELTAREFDLLVLLARYPNRVFTKADLLDKVWGPDHEAFEHTVVSLVNRLRCKLATVGAGPDLIRTVWGVGYQAQHPEV